MRQVLLSLLVAIGCSMGAHGARLELVVGGGEMIEGRPAAECRLREPFGIEFSPDGSMWIVEMDSSNRVLHVAKDGVLRIEAANGKGYAGDDGKLGNAQFSGMHNLAIAPDGTLYIADTWNRRVRKVTGETGEVSTVVGTGKKGFSGDGGPAIQADFGNIIQIALDAGARYLYLTDIENRRVRRISLSGGVVETVAGNGEKGVPADGALAIESPLMDPRAVVPGGNGFYILERSGNALRHVDEHGRVRTVAGTGKAGWSGDDGSAVAATLNGPKHLCLDAKGRVIIADAENHLIRRFDPESGTIVRIAGTGRKGKGNPGAEPLQTDLNRPHGVTLGPDGSLYIVDTYNDRILKLEE